jgi:cytoskeletal protein CcmA (bactofilin family)
MKKFLVLVMTVLLLVQSNSTKAGDFRSGPRVSLARGDSVKSDLYAWAQDVSIDGLVQGDLLAGGKDVEVNGTVLQDVLACGETVTINGTVQGDANGFAKEVRIHGTIERGIRAGAGIVIIDGHVKGDVLAGGGKVVIKKDAIVDGDMTVGAGELVIEGTVLGSVQAGVGKATLAGTIGKNVNLHVDDGFAIPAGAQIGGNLKYLGRKQITIDGTVQGETKFVQAKPRKRDFTPFKFIFKIWSGIAALVIGLALVLLLKKIMLSTAEVIQNESLRSATWGFIALIAVPVVCVFSFILIVTIPLGFLLMGLFLIALYSSRIFASFVLGHLVLQRITGRETSPYAEIALGVIFVWILINLPFIGWLAHLAAIIFGLGGMLLGIRKVASTSQSLASTAAPQA